MNFKKKLLSYKQKRNQNQLPIEIIRRNFNEQVNNDFVEMIGNRFPLPSMDCNLRNGVTIVWFDPYNINQNTIIDTQITKHVLRTVIQRVPLMCFSQKDECIDFLRQYENTAEIVFLVVSGRGSIDVLDYLTESLLKQIDSIFIFCLHTNNYESLLIKHKKIVGIYKEHDQLIEAIRYQVFTLSQRDLTVTMYKQYQSTARLVPIEAPAEFIWVRVLKETLLNNQLITKEMKNKMLDRCRLIYRNNPRAMEMIDEFSSKYKPADAIKWYTRDSFLYRLVNSALRTEDFNEFALFLPFIRDLSKALEAKRESTENKCMIFYRGCILRKTEIDNYKNNIGSFMVINSFLSSSRRRSVAEIYVDSSRFNENTDLVSVIYEINVPQNATQSGTDISQWSQFEEEEEVLFDLNSVFKLENITYDNIKQYWICKIVLDSSLHSTYQSLCYQINTILTNTSTEQIRLICLLRIGLYKEANAYSEYLLSKNGFDPGLMMLHGIACYRNCNYNQAINYLTRTRNIFTTRKNSSNKFLAFLIASIISEILINLGEITMASNYAQKLKIQPRICQFIKLKSISVDLSRTKMANVDQNRQDLVGDYSIKIMGKCLSFYTMSNLAYRDLHLCAALVISARVLLVNGYYDEALEKLAKAETEAHLVISANSPVRFDIHFIFASIYLHQNNINKVYERLNLARNIAEKNYSSSSSTAISCYYLLLTLTQLLDVNNQNPLINYIPYARVAYSQSNDLIDIPNVALSLWNICRIHETRDRKPLNVSQCTQLEQIMEHFFDLFAFDKILYGKSQNNQYRNLINYARQVKLTSSKLTYRTHEENSILTRL